ncbi:RNA-directed DNA polymerase, eukaryota [Tanacetum coccineum]
MEKVSHMDVKFMWGNSNYDYVFSEAAGNSGGILCIWEESFFKKDYVTISDSFVAIYGTWIPSKTKLLVVSIYAPQQPSLRRVLWEYLLILLGRWNGEAILMGDYNEVRTNVERRGTCFNVNNASFFNQFISSSGLVDIKMEGYTFTWSHPSAEKMSKLDRFLVSDGILTIFPSISALCLDRHLSDHRPILLCEVKVDFGPIPFRFYHSWFKLVGFDDMVEQTWRALAYSDNNKMIRFKKKLQELKKVIRLWVNDKKIQSAGSKNSIVSELRDIDKHDGRYDFVHESKIRWRIEVTRTRSISMESLQKRSKSSHPGVFVDGFVTSNGSPSDEFIFIGLKQGVSFEEKGGLGVSSYFALNRALLLKWVLAFRFSKMISMRFVLPSVYGDKIDSHSVRKVPYGSSILKGSSQVLNSGEFSVKDTRLAIDDLVLPSHSEPTRRFCIVFAVGGRSISSFGIRSQNGTSGSLLFVFRVQLKVFWKESSTLLGGLFGDFGIVLLSFSQTCIQNTLLVRSKSTVSNSFAAVLKSGSVNHNIVTESSPAIVLDDACIMERDFSCSLMGKMKDINALSNLFIILANEGFENVKLFYLGGQWVLLELDSVTSKEKITNHVGVGSWFEVLKPACNSFMCEERLVWVAIEGLPVKALTRNTYAKIVASWGELVDINESDNASFHAIRVCSEYKTRVRINDRVKIILRDSVIGLCFRAGTAWMPEFQTVMEDALLQLRSNPVVHCLGNKAKKGWIQELNTKHRVNFVALQETKMEKMDLFSIKALWGNLSFDYAFSPSIGYSGGILCVWDPRLFVKDNSTVSDSFLAISGTWIPSSTKLLVISVYAPQDLTERRMLWDFIHHLIDSWDGECVLLGDFNEVRFEHERRGSLFNSHGANSFNNFITRTGLIDLPLEGYSFTWAHKSASKMSKLDRFLISEGLLALFPSISALCLDKHLSDHRPILLRELNVDYGPTPFRFFHSWSSRKGFDKMVEDSWKNSVCMESNSIIKLKKKLQSLKSSIKHWLAEDNQKSNEHKRNIQNRLIILDKIFDQGSCNDDLIHERSNLLKELQDFNKSSSLDMAQKAKIRWAIEGDENSKFFHGIINKKRSQLAIHGVLADGDWIVEPSLVKNEFLKHFATRFAAPSSSSITFDYQFPNRLTPDQIGDLERNVSYEEIKRAVWDCGISKSPGPDGFTFEFYRKYWSLIDHDVVAAVISFFSTANFGFGLKWRSWIQGCLNSAMGSILVNGSPTSEFKFSKGLKQGDPLSPFLFIMIMESLHLSFNNVVNAGLYNGIQIDESLNLSHLFYADDVIFVATKSIGCSILHTPFNYLGVKVGGIMSRLSSWDDSPLKQTYPRLYFLELDKHVSVASKLRANSFISSFRRSPRSGIEEEQLLLLISNTS